METIGHSEVWSYFNDQADIQRAGNAEIRRGPGHTVSSYLELAKKVATLQFKNPEHVLLFRGQTGDYRNQKKNTTLKPSLFRPRRGEKDNPDQNLLVQRFGFMDDAERELVTLYCRRASNIPQACAPREYSGNGASPDGLTCG